MSWISIVLQKELMSFLKCHYRLENVRGPGKFQVIAFSCTAALLSAVAPIGSRSGQQGGGLAPALELVTAFQWSEVRSKTPPPQQFTLLTVQS